MANPMVSNIRGVADGALVAVGYLGGGLTFNQIGPTVPGGFDASRNHYANPTSNMVRFRGQLFFGGIGSIAPRARIFTYDEGGSNDWEESDGALIPSNPTAKGAQGYGIASTIQTHPACLDVVQTENGDYLVASSLLSSAIWVFARYRPDLGTNGQWDTAAGADIHGTTIGTHETIVWNGQVWVVAKNNQGTPIVAAYNPDTHSVTEYTFSDNVGGVLNSQGRFFTLHGRLFIAYGNGSNTLVTSPDQFDMEVYEFVGGAFTRLSGTGLAFGSNQNNGNNICSFLITPTKVLLIGGGPWNTLTGLVAYTITTVGDSPTGALVVTEVTFPVIPTTLIASNYTPPGGSIGSFGGNGSQRIYGFTTTAEDGSKRHFLYYHSDGVGDVTVASLYEVTDDTTEMALDASSPDSDSDYSYPTDHYGGGHRDGGVDESTRYVSVGPRGYAKGPAGVIVKCRGYGDGTVLAYHNKVGTFTVGETITGGTSGATAILAGDGAAEGLYVRDVVGAFAPDETVTGGTSGATADLNTVLLHGAVTGGPFQVGETVTGGTSGATGTVTHLGLGGVGELLVKVELTSGTFVNGETITGGTSGASAVLSAAPRGYHGGAADKVIRARYFWSGGVGGQGKGVPTTGYCTMVAGTGIRGTVSKGTGPGGSDELVDVVADGGFGSTDTPSSFQWDFVADGLPSYKVANVVLEIDRV